MNKIFRISTTLILLISGQLLYAGNAFTLAELAASTEKPLESSVTGKWGYDGNCLVFMDKSGKTPSEEEVDKLMLAMGASYDNLVFTLNPDHKGSLRLGDRSVDFDWTLDSDSRVLNTKVALFKLNGYIYADGNRLIMVYSRSDLFMMMRYLCSAEGKKNIKPLGQLLDCCEGLTVGMEFK